MLKIYILHCLTIYATYIVSELIKMSIKMFVKLY